MPKDYSTPPSPDSGDVAGWFKGDLPHSEVSRPAAKPAASKRGEAPRRAAGESLNGALSLEALVECLLFVADGPVPVTQIAEALEVSPREVEAALTALSLTFQGRGLSLQRFRDRVQLTTTPGAAEHIQRFLGLAATTPLTRASLETLAIIAYQQPITRPQIEVFRGVNCDSVLKNLLSKGLIEEVGRTDGPGRPVLYATTAEFLQHFGLTSLSGLPPLNLEVLPTLVEPRAVAGGSPPPEADMPTDVPQD